jgi:hypothetical protein
MSRRLGHGESITIEEFQRARESVAESVANVPFAFAAAQPVDLKDFDFMFPKLQNNANNLLPEDASTPANLARLGKTMVDATGNDPAGDSDISAIFTYFGQFIDHDITLELASADLAKLTSPSLTPLPLEEIRNNLRNARTATLDLDSLYDLPAPRDGNKMLLGKVSPTPNNTQIPFTRPKGKDDFNDLPRNPRSGDPSTDRAANIGDPRNDENTIVAQLHTAFLRAHNALADKLQSFTEARRTLRQQRERVLPAIRRAVLHAAGIRRGGLSLRPHDGAARLRLQRQLQHHGQSRRARDGGPALRLHSSHRTARQLRDAAGELDHRMGELRRQETDAQPRAPLRYEAGQSSLPADELGRAGGNRLGGHAGRAQPVARLLAAHADGSGRL